MKLYEAAVSFIVLSVSGCFGRVLHEHRTVREDPGDMPFKINAPIEVNVKKSVPTKNIKIRVLDRPIFSQREYDANVTENTMLGTIIQQVSATENDNSGNSRIEYHLENDFDSTFFIDSKTGEIYVYRILDHERETTYKLRVLATDQGKPDLTGYASVRVYVKDVNDNAPKFIKEKFEFEVPRDIAVGTEVGQVIAVDRDSGDYGKLSYVLDGLYDVPFVVLGNGVIIADLILNKSQCRYNLRVMATDAIDRPMYSLRSFVDVTVTVRDG